MDWLQAAILFEKEGEDFYWELADKTDNRGIKNICLMLARDESEHRKSLEAYASGRTTGKTDSKIIEEVKSLFRRFTGGIFDAGEPLAQEALYLKAMELEKKSHDFYLEQAQEAGKPEQKAFLERLAGEEARHLEILGNILEFRKYSGKWILDQGYEKMGRK